MTYEQLEKAMINKNDQNYKKYLEIREKNLHKMNPIPVCTFNAVSYTTSDAADDMAGV